MSADKLITWDDNNKCFKYQARCPYPPCQAPVPEGHRRGLGLCRSCYRPFEYVEVAPGQGAYVTRRPDTANCTMTGRRLTGWSPLDWGEAGGGPGRSNCQADPQGAVFGSHKGHTVTLREYWTSVSPLFGADADPDDSITSVSLVRGKVVATRCTGGLNILDPYSGTVLLPHHLEWPDTSTDIYEVERGVRTPPAFRGTHMVATTYHQAQFRDLKPYLFKLQNAETSPTLVTPTTDDRCFFGPPLGVDWAPPLFCLLEGRGHKGQWCGAPPALRFFSLEGVEQDSCEVPDIARPPVFDAASGKVVWINTRGDLGTLSLGSAGVETRSFPVAEKKKLHITDRPTCVLASDRHGRTEVWIADVDDSGALFTLRCPLGQQDSDGQWVWKETLYAERGKIHALAVGQGSRSRRNTAGGLVAITTDRWILSISKITGEEYAPIDCAVGSGVRGSPDPPLICSAGVIGRTWGALHLASQGTDWNDNNHTQVPVHGPYNDAQGIALFGRAVLIGCGTGVKSFYLVVE